MDRDMGEQGRSTTTSRRGHHRNWWNVANAGSAQVGPLRVGTAAPIEVKSVSHKEMRFTARHSEVLTGCKTNVKLQLQPDGTITGTRGQDEMKFSKN
jgi:hypothetical protein